MKNILIYLGLVVVIVALYGFAFAFAADKGPDGKQIFLDKKCTTCHYVESAGIETTKKSGASDLSTVGDVMEADFMTKYLLKEEKIDDKAHKTKFNGTDEELKALVDWLLTLKAKEE
ncbi:MAG: cytochrome c [Ignavibacteriaceae bacterium]|nr:cytochrome c [Ignavibacteriaceae bacterium]